ncbi:hypothetical protein CVT24_008878 [Panaeolus cyanescens]|uniref:AB hydrolase-1 domain-containing protein n=1 Tax=Panaeolus cyanescens TaxID=181874 RepID=A0A409VDL6_9AGAR|nr:hypothetical protein CVT24_008878 [Panaeolus cyanescens]
MQLKSVCIRGLQYSYCDSGEPDASTYDTIFILHGHTFHSATFERLLASAPTRALRLIAINRRGYPGSTPINDVEAEAMNSSSEDIVQDFLEQHGVNFALAIDRLILELALPPGRNVTLSAWSLGNCFLVNILACIKALDDDVRDRLRSRVRGVIFWDPPSFGFGLLTSSKASGDYVPLYDESIPPENREAVFSAWVSAYWKHGDLSTHDINQVQQRNFPMFPLPTSYRMKADELKAMTCIGFKCIKGGNHFVSPSLDALLVLHELLIIILLVTIKVMWEHPEITLDAIQECISGDMSQIAILTDDVNERF